MTLKSILTLSTAITVACVTSATAQDDINLRSQDGSVDISGKFVALENGTYHVRTELGALKISAERVDCFGDACPTLSVATTEDQEQVTIQSADKTVTVTGTLLGFENDTYLLETGFGKLQIQAAGNTCTGISCPELNLGDTEFSIASSGELSDGLMMELLQHFAQRQDTKFVRAEDENGAELLNLEAGDGGLFASVRLDKGNSSKAVQALLAGQADLAATTRSVFEDERTSLIGENADDITRANTETVLALDALSIAVHPDNPVRAISEANIARIFAGDITDWSELGGNQGPIKLYGRVNDSGTTTVFNSLVMGPARQNIAEAAMLLDSDKAVSEAVENDPNAIGYTSFSALNTAKPLAIRGECGIQTPATEFTIKTEEYPFARRIFMYRPVNSIPQTATDFVDFVKSSEAQAVVTQAGYIGQDVTSVSVNEQGLRFVSAVLPTDADATYDDIQGMLTDLVAADRLSLTFRFDPGSARLDTRSQADAARLARMIENGDFESKEVLFIGFTDSIGLGEINVGLSEARANQVRDTVLAQTEGAAQFANDIKVIGYGEMSPLGCNETVNGRAINRRVEVWTRDIVN